MSAAAALALEMVIPNEKLVRVLIIDDNATFLETVRAYFEAQNYSVDTAESIVRAKKLITEHDYQIILADINFQGEIARGDRFVLKHHHDFKGARVAVVTGLDINSLTSRNALEKLG